MEKNVKDLQALENELWKNLSEVRGVNDEWELNYHVGILDVRWFLKRIYADEFEQIGKDVFTP